MIHERYVEKLSEHLDGTLPEREARTVDAHLAACPDCAAVREELAAVVAAAAALEDRPPPRDLWPGIAAAIGAPGADVLPMQARAPVPARANRPARRRRVSLSVPQLAAAGLALALASGAAAWWARPLAVGQPAAAVAPAPTADAGVIPAALPGEPGWAREVARLEARLADADGLDAATVRVLERNLTIIDRAIRESRAALASDPGNPFLEEHLERSWARKLSMLREAADMAGWARS